ncbi:uncharacterized protein A1O9_07432 [Exophiala aquamarina CBS 119918]|uniref:Xylanolytic transcriptional activator regulatory domain-containing protein n=1 Tax=Exophiala aquamarina CBS 119918 TaxID=1182545 RepID=A0A072P809_9EURO|nr:uncharacterized protein A1O9_07432 [Exophiala aquamarina CBS 119918]KEF55852.1 hypothetical protein A1O9_07432 [Exophiala aquamarina CBS 119918]
MLRPTDELNKRQLEEMQSPGRLRSLNQERPSTYGLVDQGFDSQNSALPSTEAIPDATPDHFSTVAIGETSIPIAQLIGTDLPSAVVTEMLFETFIKSVHWFMLIFHEPSLREEMNSALTTGRVGERNLSNIVLILVVLLIATKYVAEEDVISTRTPIDIDHLQAKLLRTVESKFLAVLDQDNVGAVQVCVLLSSFYFYHGRPNRCLAINSAAIRMAQNLKFNRERSWQAVDTIEREQRRRVWWALYVLDGYGSITYGTTTIIKGSQCLVNLPQNIDDTSARCPGFDSIEKLEDGTTQPVTTLSYQRYKFRLYRIAEPIMGEIYFHDGRPIPELVKKVQEINRQLVKWEETVPLELRPKSFSSLDPETSSDPLTRTFQLQALALQLSYDNIQLVLHRPLLVYNGVLSLGHHVRVPKAPASGSDFWEMSKDLCWKSAHRTACVDEYLAVLRPVQNFYTSSYIGIQTFTAGVMLGIFALSKPFEAQAQEAKRSIGRLVKMPKLLGYRTMISDQTGSVLQRLLRLILDEELKLLTSDDAPPIVANKPTPIIKSGLDNSPIPNNVPTNAFSGLEGISNSNQTSNRANEDQIPLQSQIHSHVEVLSPGFQPISKRSTGPDISTTVQAAGLDDDDIETILANPAVGTYPFDSSFLSELDDVGQGWMWEDCHQFG